MDPDTRDLVTAAHPEQQLERVPVDPQAPRLRERNRRPPSGETSVTSDRTVIASGAVRPTARPRRLGVSLGSAASFCTRAEILVEMETYRNSLAAEASILPV